MKSQQLFTAGIFIQISVEISFKHFQGGITIFLGTQSSRKIALTAANMAAIWPQKPVPKTIGPNFNWCHYSFYARAFAAEAFFSFCSTANAKCW
jgi:hypothetical protein